LLEKGEEWLQAVPAVSIGELDISGADLLDAIQSPPGPWVGKILQELLMKVALGIIPNHQTDLLDHAKLHFKRRSADD
jgi:tRNA nucleotidyltransferase (CCA-adding enzyme)